MRLIFLACTYVCVCVYFTFVKGEGERQVEIDRKLCDTKEECNAIENSDDERTKYWTENSLHQHSINGNDNTIGNVRDNIEVITANQYEPKLPNEITQSSDTTNGETLIQQSAEEKAAPAPQQPPGLYEFPLLTRINPVKVSILESPTRVVCGAQKGCL